MKFLVTVKLPKNKEHDPKNKVTGPCPVSNSTCTDATGEHHTVLWEGSDSLEEAQAYWARTNVHITRIEEV